MSDDDSLSHHGGGSSTSQNALPIHDADGNTVRIMLSTDNHLGYNERDPVRGT